MSPRRSARIVFAALALSALVPAAPARAGDASTVLQLRPPVAGGTSGGRRAEFRAETEGSPQPTIVGGWSDGAAASNEARLTFAGGHAVGDSTRFVGTWVGPPSTSSRQPRMTIDFDLGYANALGREITIVHAVRARFAGGRWGPWVEAKTALPGSESSVVSGKVDVVVPLDKPRRVQFQWRISGVVQAPATLSGDFRLNVS